jgi:hypothetical protein
MAADGDTRSAKKAGQACLDGRKKKRKHNDEEESEDDDQMSDASDDEYDLSEYAYLQNAMHYDPEDKGVFKCVKIVAEDFGDGAQVVVYRSKYLENSKKWGKVDKSPVHVSDIEKYHKHPQNKKNVDAIINPKGMKR